MGGEGKRQLPRRCVGVQGGGVADACVRVGAAALRRSAPLYSSPAGSPSRCLMREASMVPRATTPPTPVIPTATTRGRTR